MDIVFNGKYKSITSFEWKDIPNFVVITGPNGTGKSQILNLIFNTVINKSGTTERLNIIGKVINPGEITFLKGEWNLQDTSHIDLASLQRKIDDHYTSLKQNHSSSPHGFYDEYNLKLKVAFAALLKQANKSQYDITKEEFVALFPENIIENESQLSQKISEFFYNYRLSEIELLANGKNPSEIKDEIGEKPWTVLREIIKEAKLPFEINDPSENGFRDGFRLKLTSQILNEEVMFNDLSSGEKVLISLAFYLYNSQEKNIFPKLLLLDEPDAHLHPSMSQQFISVIKNVLVDKFGVQVIMTTHSPSTVMLSPLESIYEMSKVEPRIKKVTSKNEAVSLLTAGLVYVGEGTKYFLVEDNDDVTFYSYIHDKLTTEKAIDPNIPLVFIPGSTKDKSGGKDIVRNWVDKLVSSGLNNIVHGLIDEDYGNDISDGVYKIERYSIENYLIDPIVVYSALLDKERQPAIEGIDLSIGEEYKLKALSNELLQKVANTIIASIESKVIIKFIDFDETEKDLTTVSFTNGSSVQYPKWILSRRGKTILNEVYNEVFTSPIINFTTLFKAFRKLNMFPNDIVSKFIELKSAKTS